MTTAQAIHELAVEIGVLGTFFLFFVGVAVGSYVVRPFLPSSCRYCRCPSGRTRSAGPSPSSSP